MDSVEGIMYRYQAKLGVFNERQTPHIICVEPWANDYTLMPREDLVVVAFNEESVPWFNVVEGEGWSQVYCEQASHFQVFQGDRELECGHNRQPDSAG
jgi:hypothetical protein